MNEEAVEFVQNLRTNFKEHRNIFIGGLIGSKNDCYDSSQALSSAVAEEFHAAQVQALAKTSVDFLVASTLPALSEACGMALAMEKTGKEYMLSFVADEKGSILDGTPLPRAIAEIDRQVKRKPLGFFVNCVHPSIFLRGLDALGLQAASLRGRLLGFQGNTSRRDPREFDSLPELETQDPENFAQATIQLGRKYNINMLGGCCGTSPTHIQAIGSLLTQTA